MIVAETRDAGVLDAVEGLERVAKIGLRPHSSRPSAAAVVTSCARRRLRSQVARAPRHIDPRRSRAPRARKAREAIAWVADEKAIGEREGALFVAIGERCGEGALDADRDCEDRRGGLRGNRLPPPECRDRRWRSMRRDNCRVGSRRSPVSPIRRRQRKPPPRRRLRPLTGQRRGKGLPAGSETFDRLCISHAFPRLSVSDSGVEPPAQATFCPLRVTACVSAM